MTPDQQRAMFAGASVHARAGDVVLELEQNPATLTPRQAQWFAFQLAAAYSRAGGLERNRQGNLILSSRAR